MSLDSGRRNKRITIERNTPTRNGLNELIDSWTTYARPWADVFYGSGSEQRAAAQADATQAASFEILRSTKSKAITVRDRINFNGCIWDIRAIADLGLNEGLKITAICRVS